MLREKVKVRGSHAAGHGYVDENWLRDHLSLIQEDCFEAEAKFPFQERFNSKSKLRDEGISSFTKCSNSADEGDMRRMLEIAKSHSH
ncbi:hypothetical protein QYF36_002809 [Acer negundo]|nr:hypothetical protein QYF36_002809 [Acer negundo]